MYVCVHVCLYTCVSTRVRICVCVHVCLCMQVSIYVHTYASVYLCDQVYPVATKFIRVGVHVYRITFHTHVCTHLRMQDGRRWRLELRATSGVQKNLRLFQYDVSLLHQVRVHMRPVPDNFSFKIYACAKQAGMELYQSTPGQFWARGALGW